MITEHGNELTVHIDPLVWRLFPYNTVSGVESGPDDERYKWSYRSFGWLCFNVVYNTCKKVPAPGYFDGMTG